MSKILVIGATGNVGRPLVRQLLARGEAVKAASRSGKPVEGAEGVAFDILKPDFNTLFDGVDRIFLMLPSGYSDSKGLLTPIVEAAAARNVKIVLQTAYGVNADDSIPYRQVELAVEKAGVPFVILRPNWFADNFQTFWKYGVTHGQISTPAANGKSAFIDVRDIAASAAEALTSSRFDGKAFDLTGPAALSYAEAAETLSGVLGKTITYQHMEPDSFIAMLAGAGVPQDYAAFVTSLFHPVREGWSAGITDHVKQLTGRAPHALRDYAEHNKAALLA
jgi:uncharacterized protein YbjT (DUF2867 family)